jgi:hypothetical protein
MSTIRKSVGRGGTNQPADVRVIQELLKVTVNGVIDDRKKDDPTIAAIEEFQKRVVKMSRPDVRVDPWGKTFLTHTLNLKEVGLA